MEEGALVLRQVVMPTHPWKLQPDLEGPYHIYQKFPHRAYKLMELDEWIILILETRLT